MGQSVSEEREETHVHTCKMYWHKHKKARALQKSIVFTVQVEYIQSKLQYIPLI